MTRLGNGDAPVTADRLRRPLPPQAPTTPRPNPSTRRANLRRDAQRRPLRSAPRLDLAARDASGGATLSVFITFPSDFGLQDDFVGTCHGVMKRIAPEAQIIDITHGIPPQAVLQGALVLANTVGFMPVGVHLAIVDPGVGGLAARSPFATPRAGSSSAPTTACSCPPRVGRASPRRTSSPTRPMRSSPSRATFPRARPLRPAAAHLASRRSGRRARPAPRSRGAHRLDPEPVLADGAAVATLLYVDSFGNIALNVTRTTSSGSIVSAPASSPSSPGSGTTRSWRDVRGRRPGDVILYEDSYQEDVGGDLAGAQPGCSMRHQGRRSGSRPRSGARRSKAACRPRPGGLDLRGE